MRCRFSELKSKNYDDILHEINKEKCYGNILHEMNFKKNLIISYTRCFIFFERNQHFNRHLAILSPLFLIRNTRIPITVNFKMLFHN